MNDKQQFRAFDTINSPLLDRPELAGRSLPIENSAVLQHALEAQGMGGFSAITVSVSPGYFLDGEERKRREEMALAEKRRAYARTKHFTVGDLVSKLLALDQRLPVCLGDWNESYQTPNATEAAKIAVQTGVFNAGGECYGKFVQIGDIE